MQGIKKIAVVSCGALTLASAWLPLTVGAVALTTAGGCSSDGSDTRQDARTEARTSERAEKRVEERHD